MSYTPNHLIEHKQLWDVVTRNKEGYDKEHFFSDWCRKVSSCRKSCWTATEHAGPQSKEAAESAYRSLAEHLFATELTEEQTKMPKYKVQKNRSISTPQRSWVNTMLRKNLGDAHVGKFILNTGIPRIFNLPLRSKKKADKAMLQNMLDELMEWHVSLLDEIVTKNDDPNMAIARKLSDLSEHQWREQRRELKSKAKQQLKNGARLSEQKESGKRKYWEMSSTEKQLIEDYETQKLERDYKATLCKKPRIEIRILS